MTLQDHNGTSYRPKLTNSFPEVGKNPSSPSMGIMLSLGLLPMNHGDALTQWLYLQNITNYYNLVSYHRRNNRYQCQRLHPYCFVQDELQRKQVFSPEKGFIASGSGFKYFYLFISNYTNAPCQFWTHDLILHPFLIGKRAS